MKLSNTLIVGNIISLLSTVIKADQCTFSGGNYYCSETDAIIYSNVGLSSSYQDVTNMDESTCQCSQQSTSFSGNLSPFNEELSVHFRGPINLKQFGVYYPAASSSSSNLKKRDNNDANEKECTTTKNHQHRHKRDVAVEVVEVTATVFVNAKGESVTPVGNINVAETFPTTTAAAEAAPEADNEIVSSYIKVSTILSSKVQPQEEEQTTTSTSTSKSTKSTSTSVSAPVAGAWERASYFTPGSTSNCTFMNHQGGTAGSGTWSQCFGNSISFANSDGITGCSSATPLDDVTVASGKEFIIFSGDSCDGSNDGCGYYRDGIPAYHGFGGDHKIFVFEFLMPSDTSGSAMNQDMPAVWLLNAKIPRTLQYGDASCSCWETGCGEMDLFEILTAGSDKLISHVHDGQDGGTQDYFTRPTETSLKVAVIFNGNDNTIHIVEVSEDFDDVLSEDTVNSWLNQAGSAAALP
ncbi:Tos1p NDAI_0C05360 [Naumovozyma dairenensis CBS 421]|uniref:glucan endo-1,3-beta-D-glucosidase n=1 Tax=Naumovozyma dairenensis (strain ATCC 10597 / BCRC 20456 / CBS 421 / NBRC 0211 / NRRL Y-12639) TaxID=1071378 RepID=G0W8T4_NAUDC|nr:hypothetical protein NDAI_0C05360 [Naumovozyma dairenensis CBS 421]CCD24195.1 hypothetical protein NDAI_0C05360 [Naumovozyma dairenensis CBS 421]